MKGIDKRTHKDGTVSYRVRVRIKGHPVLIQSFASKTLAMKWKRDTESAVEQSKYAYKGKLCSSTTVVRYLASLSHAFAIAVKDWEWIQENPTMKIALDN